MSTIVITGGTGLVGSALTRLLTEKGHKVIIMTRNNSVQSDTNIRYFHWDIKSQTVDPVAFANADYVFHLAVSKESQMVSFNF